MSFFGGQIFVPCINIGGQFGDKNTIKICNYAENMEKKRKYNILIKLLI